MTNQQGAPEALRLAAIVNSDGHITNIERNQIARELRRLHAENERLAALVEAQQPAKAESLRQILTDPENQPNQYDVQFLMHGAKMAFRIGNRQFCLDYEPDEPGEFEFMRDALISAFSIFTPDVMLAQQRATHVQNPAEIEHVTGDVSKNGPESNMAPQPASSAEAVGPDAFECLHEWDGLVRTSMPPKYACKHCHNFFDAPPTPTPQADSQPAPVLDYPPLPDFDSADEPIWDAIFNWKTATPGLDALRKANAVESAIIDQLRAYVDADRAASAAPQPPAAAQEHEFASEDVQRFAIEVEKALCAALGIKWAPSGMSIATLIERLKNAQQPAVTAGAVDALTSEQERAIREAYESAGAESYFEARPQIDCIDRRRVFTAGFGRGWDAALAAQREVKP